MATATAPKSSAATAQKASSSNGHPPAALSAYGAARATISGTPLSQDDARNIDAFWRACNYLALGMTYLKANPLLKEPLKPEHVKDRLLGHWGSSPGLAFTYIHLSRAIKAYDLNVVFMAGPGHGAPGVLGPCYLEGSYSEIYPDCSEDEEGLLRLFKQFSFPGGIGSHCTPETPGSIHEGGELGYVLSHACGAAFDNPDLIVAAVVGDGESETGPLATSWHINKFLNPIRDGAVLPIFHLNGYKINNPTIWARVSREEIESFFRGTGWTPYFVEGSDPETMHQAMAATIDACVAEIRELQGKARSGGTPLRPKWPMIVLRTPKGWTCPAEVGGHRLEGSWRAHQVPLADVKKDPARLKMLEDWMRRYKPQELFDDAGHLRPELEGARSGGHPAHRIESARQWRTIEEGPANAGFSGLRDRGREAGHDRGRELPSAGGLPPRRDEGQHAQFPRLRPGRDHVQQAQRGLRGVEEALAGGVFSRRRRRRRAGRPTAASSRCSASTRSKACWKAICSPAGTGSSTPTRRSPTSSTPCSTSTPSGLRSAITCRGGRRSPR